MDLSHWIERHAGFTPAKCAIRFAEREVSYAALAARIDAVARALASAGVGSGDRVAFLGLNHPEAIALLFACARVGAMLAPLNWRLAPPEHRETLADCMPKLLVTESAFAAGIDGVKQGLPPMQCIALGDTPAWQRYEAFLAAGGQATAPRDGRDDDPVLLCYTSGSTGRPKGVLLTQHALFYNAVNSTHMHGFTSADRVLTTLPLFHVGGLNILTLPALHAGATVTLHAKFDPEATLDAIEREAITLTVLVPAQIDALRALPRWNNARLSSLRMITTGSQIVPPRIFGVVHARGVPLVEVYGSTETAPIATYVPASEAGRKAGSAGLPAMHCEIRLADETGADVTPGASGEILVRGPNVMSGYWGKPEATAEALRGGWFHSGDIGHFDEEGWLVVDGRSKDMIISGGENIYPAEIENVLAECDAIAEVAVVGRPDERWGEAVVAVVVPKAGKSVTEREVSAALEGRVARYKHPRAVVTVAQLPRTALGKIQKAEVRAMAIAAAREKVT
ncbi:MAG: AMP-binding protein [Betaproteobacteria bacterium]|jgi:fatty-acyl-CoA synthase|nr:AMP-binding protein [Betaproteobacteria bacterium]